MKGDLVIFTEKKWLTPEMIVLVRCNPEEAVLKACKTQDSVPDGPGNAAARCWKELGDSLPAWCQAGIQT